MLTPLLLSLTVIALLVAGLALAVARRTARRFDGLAEAYWELRYEHGQAVARLSRLENPAAPAEPDRVPAQPAATTSFVPLSSLKR
jgi:hypothetical protein